MRRLLRKIKYLLLFLSCFCLISNVYAEQGIASANGQKFITSFSGTFADNTNNYLTRITAGFDSQNIRYYSNPIVLSGTSNNGAAVVFDALEPFVAGYTYSVSILLNTNNNNILHPSESRICVAETLNNSIARYNQPNNFSCTNAISMTHTTGAPNPFYIDNSGTGNLLNYNILTYVFTPDFTGTSIGFNFNSDVRGTYTLFFGGYIATVLSDNQNISQSQIQSAVQNSGLATANSVNQVQSSINEVKQELAKQAEEQKKTNEKLDKIDDTINSTDTTGASSSANSFFDNFQDNDYGLSDIITMPLTLIKTLTNSTCVSLKLTVPFVNKTLELPCMSSIYQKYFGSFFTLYQTVTFGFVAYWVAVKIYALVKGFKDPDDDKIEVVDL